MGYKDIEIPMKFDSVEYDSPLSIIQTSFDDAFRKFAEAFDDQVVLEVRKQCGIDIDKEKLEKVLTQDRDRYQEAYKKGYTKGYLDRENELVRCRDCKWYHRGSHYCKYDTHHCRSLSDSTRIYGLPCDPDWYCADAQKEDEET